jgi:adenylyltransferase/sulfurtransferase
VLTKSNEKAGDPKMAKSYQELLKEVKGGIREVTVEQVNEMLSNGEGVLLLDVREKDEWREGYIEGAVNVTRGMLEMQVERVIPDKSAKIVCYCAGGIRSAFAAKVMMEMGYEDVVSMAGGFNGWKQAGFRFLKDRVLTPDQVSRYSRHFILPQVGEKGQGKLLDAKVLLVGAGGLGSPAGLYLAASGVGTLGLVDSDVVDITNLQRQVLHRTADVDRPKTESARDTIAALNPDVQVNTYQEKLTSGNVMEIIEDYDLVVDGCDNFPTRYLVNDACVLAGKPNVHGSIFQFEGQATVFQPGQGPCYRCLYPTPPPPGMVPS